MCSETIFVKYKNNHFKLHYARAGKGVLFLMTGMKREVSKIVLKKVATRFIRNPELFDNLPIVEEIIPIRGKEKKANVYVREVKDEFLDFCGLGEFKKIRCMHVIVPDRHGRTLDNPRYDNRLFKLQFPYFQP